MRDRMARVFVRDAVMRHAFFRLHIHMRMWMCMRSRHPSEERQQHRRRDEPQKVFETSCHAGSLCRCEIIALRSTNVNGGTAVQGKSLMSPGGPSWCGVR